ncbi:hypothetical protein [Hymenobacter latericus]|uniref:hypothetical protein n=1 Tax=Hymenobacter sp. YIM 151858-1 TaxID=2987688 RepID=UPI002226C095|nr:hypothetical protein [Hymenobacter sp. YIM 151858-1]UYZ60331.1 hypothetical protein OIS50_05910 [Hymenobacter sp. YIM 151858-1]
MLDLENARVFLTGMLRISSGLGALVMDDKGELVEPSFSSVLPSINKSRAVAS